MADDTVEQATQELLLWIARYADAYRDTNAPGFRDEVEASIDALIAAVRAEQRNDGNTFVFCDHVEHGSGCVRGAGHNGPHVFMQRNINPPLAPVVLQPPRE